MARALEAMPGVVTLAFGALLLLWIMRVAWLLRKYRARPSGDPPVRTLAVLGSGGHTAEMIQLLQAMDRAKFGPMLYVIAQTDTTSADRIKAFEQSVADRQPPPAAAAAAPAYRLLIVPRSREVGQSYATSALTTLHALAYSVWHVFVALPSLVLCNGPGTCVPICAAALLVRLLGIKYISIVYVESVCRVESLSLSGKIMLRLADHFLVQWPGLTKKYPRAQFIGRLC